MQLLDDLGVTGIPAITVICYFAAELLKQLGIPTRWLPVICASLGCVLGAAARFVIPDYPGDNLYSALATGIVSGFAATGVHQGIRRTLGRAGEEKTKG